MFLERPTKKFKLLLTVILLLLCSMTVLTACGSNGSKTDTSSPSTNEGNPATTNEPTNNEVRTIEHAMGKTDIKGTPERVVILTNEGTEALLALGVKPVGAVKSWTGDPWYDHIKDQMEGVTMVGLESQVNIEAIAALKPDLILGNKMRQEEVFSQLSGIAPTVFSDTLRGEWKDNFALYAKALNKENEGNKVIADFDQKVSELRNALGDKINTKVSIVRYMAGKTRIYYKDTFSGIILDQIGITRPEAQNKDTFADEITRERIPEMEGDILFYFSYETGDGEASKQEDEWLKDPLFQNLNVVKSGKAFKVSDTIWNTAGGAIAANLLLDELKSYLLEN